jgi:hypothetical protein
MLRSIRTTLLLTPALVLLGWALTPRPAAPLPLFARKYSMECTQCHVAFPRLNAFGMKFRQNGYRLEGAKGESPWDGQNFPLSLVGNVGASYTGLDTVRQVGPDAGKRQRTGTTQFNQNAVEFHTAGTLAENVTFHFDNGFAGPGGVLESGMAFVQLDDLVKDGALNLKAGIYDAELPYLSDSRKTTFNGYLSPVTLDGRGFELNGTKSGWTYAAGLINSERTTGKPDAKSLNNLENGYLWLMRDVKGHLVASRVLLEQQDPRKPNAGSSKHLMAQASAFINGPRLILVPGFTYEGFADVPDTAGSGRHTLGVTSGLLEATALLGKGSRCVLTARYELRHVPESAVTRKQGDDTEVALNLGYYLNANAKLGLDWTHTTSKIHDFFEDDPFEPATDQVQLYAHVGY